MHAEPMDMSWKRHYEDEAGAGPCVCCGTHVWIFWQYKNIKLCDTCAAALVTNWNLHWKKIYDKQYKVGA